MKSKSIITILIFVAILFTSCDNETIRAEGEVTTRSFSFTNYTGLRASDSFSVFVTFSDTEESIEIDANDNLHKNIVVEQDGNNLVIRLRDNVSIKGRSTLNVYIVTNDLSKFDLSGASEVSLENDWTTKAAEIVLSGASNLEGKINTEQLIVKLDGASDLDLFGSANSLNARLSGSSTFKDYDLSINDLTIEFSGSSDAFLTVNETIDAEASGPVL
ncbi:head GIN domain-containing protein [Croceitalea rosinachiae]|uniref:Head GIN domain-containing protein n=1 Tax=Croceitalea rosinachiae TaxID=3075596 RepID=A0ABU3ABG7_9FLAO|nr:head GIN domain-containing protein [Croceitalea sp. F388]MDT0607504.1 head GIN domain-containing protein [Croceitalea sp. F388]